MRVDCKEALQRAYLFLDGEVLSETERHDIEIHLQECTPCLEHYGLEEELFALVARLRAANPCPDGLKSRIASLLQQA